MCHISHLTCIVDVHWQIHEFLSSLQILEESDDEAKCSMVELAVESKPVIVCDMLEITSLLINNRICEAG